MDLAAAPGVSEPVRDLCLAEAGHPLESFLLLFGGIGVSAVGGHPVFQDLDGLPRESGTDLGHILGVWRRGRHLGVVLCQRDEAGISGL